MRAGATALSYQICDMRLVPIYHLCRVSFLWCVLHQSENERKDQKLAREGFRLRTDGETLRQKGIPLTIEHDSGEGVQHAQYWHVEQRLKYHVNRVVG